MEQFGKQWNEFQEICLLIFRKSVEKIQFSLKSDRNNGHFTGKAINTFDHISVSFSLSEKFETKFVEKIKARLCYRTFFRKSYRL